MRAKVSGDGRVPPGLVERVWPAQLAASDVTRRLLTILPLGARQLDDDGFNRRAGTIANAVAVTMTCQ